MPNSSDEKIWRRPGIGFFFTVTNEHELHWRIIDSPFGLRNPKLHFVALIPVGQVWRLPAVIVAQAGPNSRRSRRTDAA